MSLINKALTELDKRKANPDNVEGQETKSEVAFLENSAERKMTDGKAPRSKTWWLRVVSSIATVVLAVVVGVLYYNQMNQSLDLLDVTTRLETPTPETTSKSVDDQAELKKSELNPSAQTEQAAQQTGSQVVSQNEAKPDVPVDQPKLVVLKPVTADGAEVERQSTLTVTQAQQTQSSTPQSSEPVIDAVANEEPIEQVQSQVTNVVTKANLPKPEGAPEASDEQMSISKVEMTPQQRAEKFYLQGKKLAQDGMIQPAIDKFLQALQFNSAHEQSRVELAGLYYGRNMVAEALEVLSDGLNAEPSNRVWSLLAAKIHYRRDNYAAALAYLQLPVHAREDVEYVALKAGVLQKLKRFDQAAEVFSQLTSSYPDNGRWWMGLATSLESKQDRGGAIAAYRRSLRLSNMSERLRQFASQRLQALEN